MNKTNLEHTISVIVPAYNAEMTIDKCISSLIQQTYRNIQVILVNDGSEDETGNICDFYQQSYQSLIKVIHTHNVGVTNARLLGVKKASGVYVAFVDADDWVEEDYISSMLTDIKNADIVVGGICKERIYDKTNSEYEYNGISVGSYVSEHQKIELYEKILYCDAPYQFGILPYMCNKIFKKDLIQTLLEEVDKRIYDGEDAAIVYPYLLLAKEIMVTNNCKYHYVLHNNSASMKNAKDAYLNATYLYQELYHCFFNSKYKELLIPQLDQYMRRLIWKKEPEKYLMVNSFVFPFHKIEKGSRIILYGMGKMGITLYQQIKRTNYCNITAWADRNEKIFSDILTSIHKILPSEIRDYSFDYIVIAIEQKMIRHNIVNELCLIGIDKEKIIEP